MERKTVARWQTPSGAYWVEMYQDQWGYGYDARGAGGWFGSADFETALADLERMIKMGCFQPGSRPVERVDVPGA